MFESLQRVGALVEIGIKNSLAYKLDYLFSFGFRIVFALLMLFVWSAVYTSSHTGSIGGFTINQMYAYYFLAGVIYIIMTTEIDQQLQQDIQSGDVTVAMIRPISYVYQLFFNSFSSNFLYMLGVIPLLAIAAFFVHFSITPLTVLLLVAELLVGFMIANLFDFIIGSLAVYLTQVWGIMVVTYNLQFLLSGGLLPLSLFPSWASNILLLLPFQMELYTPAATLLGTMPVATMVQEILVGAVWAVVLFAISALMWRKMRKGITAVGG